MMMYIIHRKDDCGLRKLKEKLLNMQPLLLYSVFQNYTKFTIELDVFFWKRL